MYRLDHLALVVKDSELSKNFYCDVLGCTVVKRMVNDELKFIYLQTGGLTIELLEYLSNPLACGRGIGIYDHLAFTVPDINAAMVSLKEKGINFETDTPRTTSAGNKIIFCSGPDGERIELMEQQHPL